MNKNKKQQFIYNILVSVFLFIVLLAPTVSYAGLVPCNNNTKQIENPDGTITQPVPCDFNAFMDLINNILDFILYALAIPVCAIMFFYAGFLLVTAGGEAAHARQKAKSIFVNALVGLVLAFAAWLIIKTLLSILGYDGSWIFQNF